MHSVVYNNNGHNYAKFNHNINNINIKPFATNNYKKDTFDID